MNIMKNKKSGRKIPRSTSQTNILGRSYHACYAELRKNVLHRLRIDAGYTTCFRCNRTFEKHHQIEMDHIIDWETSDNPYETFINPYNIAFSHRECNQLAKFKEKKRLSGYLGVSITKDGKYSARIRIKGKQKWLGTYNKAKEAAQIYDKWAKLVHGDFAVTNYDLSLLCEIDESS